MTALYKLRTLWDFIEIWTMTEMPACEVGMALLQKFADLHPEAYRSARAVGFWDLDQPGQPVFLRRNLRAAMLDMTSAD